MLKKYICLVICVGLISFIGTGLSLAGSVCQAELDELREERENLQRDLRLVNERIGELMLELIEVDVSIEESPEVLWDVARQYSNMNRIARAIDYYGKFARAYPGHELAPVAYIRMASLHIYDEYILKGGNIHLEDKDLDFAFAWEALEEMLTLYPNSEYADDAEFGIALTYLLKANRLAVLWSAAQQGTRTYNELLDIHRDNLMKSVELHESILARYQYIRSNEEVIGWTGASYATVLSEANVKFNIALIYDMLREWEKAYDSYKIYLATSPEGPRAVRARSRMIIIEEEL